VASGAALAFSSNVNYTTAEPLSIAGTGPAGNGAIENISGTNSFAGPITLAGPASIGSDAGSLTLGGAISGTGALTFTGSGNLFISGSPPSNIIKNGTGVVTLAASDSALSTTVNAGTLNGAAIDGNGTTTINSGGSLIANHIVQGSLVIGGVAGSPANAAIAASDTNGNPLNAVATGNIRTANNVSTSSRQPAPTTTTSASAVPTASTPTSTPVSSKPPISLAVVPSSYDSSGLTWALPTTADPVSTSDAAIFLERQIAIVANGNGESVHRDGVAAAEADADVLEWAASTPTARPSAADADISLLSDDLLDAIGRQWQN
jgi:hypothetical protein